ncbi:neuroparsin-A-like [Odontomachus brunneus]|uniref:neuroparsin-A-like n=1 Tax=Odontomachus brunneus TaxID=486640 RepID=UPI0013F293A8|nr:neuroparsin-A-like [Odontomachus brunneus]XP_032662969.1 neuroparsin-A-like [Odontomachus brunneus]XP_032662970.1 neuroparsin-A-like [Odontomachus brunneus]
MFILQLHIIAFLATILLISECNANSMNWQQQEMREQQPRECVGCGNECNRCKYGSTMSAFCGGIKECRRGPGEYCGGRSQSWGICGEGMICICNRCVGCSLDMLTCFSSSCLPQQNMEHRNQHDISDRIYTNRYIENQPLDGRQIEGRQMYERRLRLLNMKRK